MAKRVVQYQTTDGMLHNDKNSADLHQANLDAAAEIHKCLLTSLSTARPTSIVGEILHNVETLLPILAAYKKKTKKVVDKAS